MDPLIAWPDFDPIRRRPLGRQRVWIGYDPSRTRDDASLVVIAPPDAEHSKFRMLEKVSLQGKDFEYQAKAIKAMTQKYNVEYISIDCSGMGDAVYELVKKFYPAAKRIVYSVEVKNRLVLKTKHIISQGRFEYDESDRDLALSFMTIHKGVTASGKQISYQASRTATTGHADEAWAVMHALDNEPLRWSDDNDNTNQSMMEFF